MKSGVLLAVRRRLCGGCARITADKSGHHASRCQSGKVPVSTFAARRPPLLSDPSGEQLSARLLMVLVGKVASVAQMPQHTSSVKHSDTDNTFQVKLRYLFVTFTSSSGPYARHEQLL